MFGLLTATAVTLSFLQSAGAVILNGTRASSAPRSAATVDPGTVTGAYTGVADPTLCRDNDGTYFLFSTATGIAIRTSTDRIAWTLLGEVWPDGATWTDEYTGATNGVANIWAPDWESPGTYIDGTFYLYYAASSFGSQNSAIFFAKSTTGQPGSFTNEGLVISSADGDAYNTIDPNLILVGSDWYLSFGSFWDGIYMVPLSSDTGKPSTTALTHLAQRTADSGAIEASVIWQEGDYFYLFTSWDICCDGLSSTYNIRVGRGTSVLGPYEDESGVALTNGGGTLVLGTHDYVVGPGGQDLMTDVDGVVMVYHYYTSTTSDLGINLLDFSTGWPVVY